MSVAVGRRTRVLLRLALLGYAFSLVALAQTEVDCASCHDDEATKIKSSTHASVECATCHLRHEDFPHPSDVPKPACAQCHEQVARDENLGVHGQARQKGDAAPDCGICHGSPHEMLRPSSLQFRQAVPDTCGMCHDQVVSQYRESVHGKALASGNRNAPLCTDCHGEHNIISPKQAASPVNAGHIRDTCARCHGDVRLSRRFGLPPDVVVSFDASYHGLAGKGGSQSAANCASCHGYHNILPSSDPKSSINAKNLPATCGKCHPGAGSHFALGSIHWLEGGKEPPGVTWVRRIYLGLISLTIGLMLLHILADWFRKLYELSFRPGGQSGAARLARATVRSVAHPEIRMLGAERIQHGLLIISFVILAWTGFALRYPDQIWARPLLAWEGEFPVRATIHRMAGAVLIVLSLIHLLSLIASHQLRNHWREMWPRVRDARDGILNLAWLVGLRRDKPRLSSHGYVEKAEYWAVVWGTGVMAVTGVALWGVNYTLVWLPKEWLDIATAIHFYEALLATLAIFVWHFYFVIFDPEVYPMDPAWLSGQSVRAREHNHPKEVLIHLEPSPSGQGVEHTEPDRPDELPEDLGLDES